MLLLEELTSVKGGKVNIKNIISEMIKTLGGKELIKVEDDNEKVVFKSGNRVIEINKILLRKIAKKDLEIMCYEGSPKKPLFDFLSGSYVQLEGITEGEITLKEVILLNCFYFPYFPRIQHKRLFGIYPFRMKISELPFCAHLSYTLFHEIGHPWIKAGHIKL